MVGLADFNFSVALNRISLRFTHCNHSTGRTFGIRLLTATTALTVSCAYTSFCAIRLLVPVPVIFT
ncbi:hypothetical protein F3W84_16905 [Ochrobactrum quorumnocens]|uniref:Uncharacterized protein n=1 Tax=Ochrobactrum quorumnocens TaxID=271865 RepID=A0A5N1JSB5_9HYPH|nr:hypothetical protein F3W84_16905 [[Ochrobactrum] quorumnocens]